MSGASSSRERSAAPRSCSLHPRFLRAHQHVGQRPTVGLFWPLLTLVPQSILNYGRAGGTLSACTAKKEHLEERMRTPTGVASMTLGAIGFAVGAGAALAFDVKEVGSFHIGGQALKLEGLPVKELVYTAGGPPTKMDPNGDFHTGQMYVQYVKLANPKAKYPLLLWHGGGLTGVTWETKPDGKPGWQMFFINAGHDVYVSD